MNILNKIKRVIERPERLPIGIQLRLAHIFDNQELLIKSLYRLNMGKSLDLKHPETFTEKIQWLKLHDHNDLYHTLVDKHAVKQYVADKIGSEYVIPTFGVWNSFDEIDFNSLPQQFVLKTTNGGGGTGVVLCKDKSYFDKTKAKVILEKSMSNDIYKNSGEWAYKGLTPRIIAEKFMIQCSGKDLKDYKIFCFNGEPKFLYIAQDRFNEIGTPPCFDFYDLNLNRLPFNNAGYLSSNIESVDLPCFNEMLRVAKNLSYGIPHVVRTPAGERQL